MQVDPTQGVVDDRSLKDQFSEKPHRNIFKGNERRLREVHGTFPSEIKIPKKNSIIVCSSTYSLELSHLLYFTTNPGTNYLSRLPYGWAPYMVLWMPEATCRTCNQLYYLGIFDGTALPRIPRRSKLQPSLISLQHIGSIGHIVRHV